MRKAATPATARRPAGATALRACFQISSTCTNKGAFGRGTYTSIFIPVTILIVVTIAIDIAIGLGWRLGLGAGSAIAVRGIGAGRGVRGAL